MNSFTAFLLGVSFAALGAAACSATATNAFDQGGGGSGLGGAGQGGSGASDACGTCLGGSYVPCDSSGMPADPVVCPQACAPGKGCVACLPDGLVCVGNDVHRCAADGSNSDPIVESCDSSAGKVCSNGACTDPCTAAADSASNVGCEFWAVDLDQVDAFNDPASAPWGVALSNAGSTQANVTIEINEAPVGMPIQTKVVNQVSVAAGSLVSLVLPTRELDCGAKPNDYAAPGTCLSSNAFRITSSAPIVVTQFNVFANAYSNDASLLLPTSALGKVYRAINWPAGHPVKIPNIDIIDRSYVTIVGVKPNTQVTVKPSWRIKGNAPIAATMAGGEIVATLGPFDVLNLETDDATFQDDPKKAADLSGTSVVSTEPVAVFSGVETTSAPGGVLEVPTYPGWDPMNTCCLDHLEDQMFPVESVGKTYVIARSPVRSTSGWREPDILRFMGVAELAHLHTSLPPPFDDFTLQPGEVRTTWTQDDVVIDSDKPAMVGQILVSNEYIDGNYIGDPSLTVFPPIEQYRSEYVILTPKSWTQNWVVITEEAGSNIQLDGKPTAGCSSEVSGMLAGKSWESRRCALADGVHKLSGDKPFGIVAYGYGNAGSYAFVGGADVKRIYTPPPLK
jgi:hypothetical protein